jgi:hypothetical protein
MAGRNHALRFLRPRVAINTHGAFSSAVLLTPPLIKTNGPGLGSAMLCGAFAASGHTMFSCDLNIGMARTATSPMSQPQSPVASTLSGASPGGSRSMKSAIHGDHDKDSDLWGIAALEFEQAMSDAFSGLPHVCGERHEALRHMWFGWDGLRRASARLLEGAYGRRLKSLLLDELAPMDTKQPVIVGLSVMFSSQVVVAMSLTTLVRELYPDSKVVWGGPHVSALREVIRADCATYLGGFGADLFVAGYAETTLVRLAGLLGAGGSFESAVQAMGDQRGVRVVSGCGDILTRPVFPLDLRPYCSAGARLTIPCQLRRGCAYGRCAFCTYPQGEMRDVWGRLRVL